MTKQLADLFEQFSTLDTSAQLEKIRTIRHHRSIERPAAAVKRVKKEVKRSEKKKTDFKALLNGLSPEQRAAIIAKLQGDLSGTTNQQSSPETRVNSVPGTQQQSAESTSGVHSSGPPGSDPGSSQT